MKHPFYKYQGTGNDFIVADNRQGSFNKLTADTIQKLCNRHFGIGADGLMLLEEKEGYDFEMKYFNADGREGSMCGNGGRCIVLFAFHLGIRKDMYRFMAVDGPHEATIRPEGIIALRMKDVHEVKKHHDDFILNTGSPHLIRFVSNLQSEEVVTKGRSIRFSKEFAADGINVNFVEHDENEGKLQIRTYERGVEDETLSCGTGVTAAALVCYHNENGFNHVEIITRGGKLQVEFDRLGENQYRHIWLCGPAQLVFSAEMDLSN